MGKINGCLKCLFIFFNVLFEIVGCVLLYGAIQTLGYPQTSLSGSYAWTWVFGFGFLGISSLGIYAACSENTLALKIFAGFMGAGMVIMIIFGIYMAVMKNKVDEFIETIAKSMMNKEVSGELIDFMQEQLRCCGIHSLDEWQGSIPDSCVCSGENLYDSTPGCKRKPAEASGPDLIYAEPCRNLLSYYMNLLLSVVMGFYFAFAVIALMGLLLSLLMVRQVKKYEGAGAAMPMKSY